MDTEHQGIIEVATSTLAAKPWLGAGAAGGSGAVSLMGVLTPYLEFTTLVVGFLIGILTLAGLIRKQFRNDE